MLDAMCEEHVVTVGTEGESLAENEPDELQERESDIDLVHGGFWDPVLIKEARMEELAGYREMQVHRRVRIDECTSHRVSRNGRPLKLISIHVRKGHLCSVL